MKYWLETFISHLKKNEKVSKKNVSDHFEKHVRSHLDYCDIIYHIPPKINPPLLNLQLLTP